MKRISLFLQFFDKTKCKHLCGNKYGMLYFFGNYKQNEMNVFMPSQSKCFICDIVSDDIFWEEVK